MGFLIDVTATYVAGILFLVASAIVSALVLACLRVR
jgi:hypothetical protein